MTTNKQYRIPENPHYIGAFNWRGFLGAVVVFIILNWVITTYLAHYFAWQSGLGTPLFMLGHAKIYQPFYWVVWAWNNIFSAHDANIRWTFIYAYAAGVCTLLAAAAVLALANMSRTKRLSRNTEDLKGSAHWATPEEIRMTRTLTSQGVYIGGWQDPQQPRIHYLRHDGPEHVLAFAPTRAGKGVGLVIPTLLAGCEQDSAVIYDIKGENWELTSGCRAAMGHLCFRFSPTEENSARFNPLEEIRLFTRRDVADAQNIARIIVDTGEGGGHGDERYWIEAATKIMTGMILHVCYTARAIGRVASFADVSYAFTNPAVSFRKFLKTRLDNRVNHDPERRGNWTLPNGSPTFTHPQVLSAFREMLNKEDKDFSGVVSTATTALGVFDDPQIRANTAVSDFRVEDLVNHESPVALYIVIPPSDKLRLRSLVRLIFTTIVSRLTEKMEFAAGRQIQNRHRLLFLIDEFPSLKRMELFADALSYMAGYGLKAYLIAQDISQIIEAYGHHESILSNCSVRIAYAPNKQETAELLSKMAGSQTIARASYSFSGSRAAAAFANISANVEHVSRDLLTPDEAARLPMALKDEDGRIISGGTILIFISGHSPILGTQILYFLDPEFLRRSQIPPPPDRWAIKPGGVVVAQAQVRPGISPAAAQVPDVDIEADLNKKAADEEANEDAGGQAVPVPVPVPVARRKSPGRRKPEPTTAEQPSLYDEDDEFRGLVP